MIDKIKDYFKSIVVEMKKVTWLSKDELLSSAMVVGVFSIVVAIFLFFIDYGLTEFMTRIIGGK